MDHPRSSQPESASRIRGRKLALAQDRLATWIVTAGGLSCIVILILIFVLLGKEAVPFLRDYPFGEFVRGRDWQPSMDPPVFGLMPLLLGTLFVTGGAVVVAVPLGVASAIFIAEVCPPRTRPWMKAAVELLAAIPSVVMGFIGALVLAPWLKQIFDLEQTMNGLTGALLLAFMALPTIVSVAEDALNVVPRSDREASLALGATQWETIRGAVVPAAFSGIVAATMLGIGRAIGETMTVLMVTGNAGVIPHTLLQPMRTITATIAGEMGEVVHGGEHYHVLFMLGVILLGFSFLINLLSDLALRGKRGSGQSA